jgi:hypothetical protein
VNPVYKVLRRTPYPRLCCTRKGKAGSPIHAASESSWQLGEPARRRHGAALDTKDIDYIL